MICVVVTILFVGLFIARHFFDSRPRAAKPVGTGRQTAPIFSSGRVRRPTPYLTLRRMT